MQGPSLKLAFSVALQQFLALGNRFPREDFLLDPRAS